MNAGHELDHLIAEKFMGWRPIISGWPKKELIAWDVGKNRRASVNWSPSTSWQAAGVVLDKLLKRFDRVELICYAHPPLYCCQVYYKSQGYDCFYEGEDDTGPLAIARAALETIREG